MFKPAYNKKRGTTMNKSQKIIATLVIVEDIEKSSLLMIKHNRGVNKGFFNFPGGKLDSGESLEDGASREVKEETGLTVNNLKNIGLLDFPTMSFEVHVFYSNDFSGSLIENAEEVNVFWQDKEHLPINQMRDADKIWVPDALSGKQVNYRFFYDKDFNVEKVEKL